MNYLLDQDTYDRRATDIEAHWQTYVGSQHDLWRFIWEKTDRTDLLGQFLSQRFPALQNSSVFFKDASLMKTSVIDQECGSLSDEAFFDCYNETLEDWADAFYSKSQASGSAMIYWVSSNRNCLPKVVISNIETANSLLVYFNPYTGAAVWGGPNAGVEEELVKFCGKVTPGYDWKSSDVECASVSYASF